jgi:hypothetical protein
MSLAVLFPERIQDFSCVVLLAGLGTSRRHGGGWVLLGGVGAVLGAFIVLFVPAVSRAMLRFLAARHGRMGHVTRGCLTPARFLVGLVMGILAGALSFMPGG